MQELVEPCCQLLPGSWQKHTEIDSAGGPLIIKRKSKKGEYENGFNNRWNQNPQFLLRLPRSLGQAHIDLKIIVKRNDKDNPKHGVKKRTANTTAYDRRAPCIGMVVCKPSVSVTARKHRRRHNDEPRTNPMGEVMASRSIDYRKRRAHHFEGRDELAPLEAEARASQSAAVLPDQEGHVARKLTVPENEWYLQTHFVDPNECCLHLHGVSRPWIPDGLLITPCLSERGVPGQFDLEVYSTVAVELSQLPDAFAKSLAGEWTKDTSGGSHLHKDSWKKNPKFVVRFTEANSPKKVQVVLSRPGQNWVSQQKHDPVGTMIGFYIYSACRPTRGGSTITVDGNPWSETPFVPVNEVTTPQNFVVPAPSTQEDDYTIMPCTLDPNHLGPFFISVVSDCEFSLQQLREHHH